ncbi:MAG: hypothetical protein GPOALKHO_001366 [Sodalis sp.]|uniref:hypothetical protein n=1 Tax=Sodalis sp. (in: enterobacteria) TaxID=1898979 RepID=UPI0038736469|nr:MAG: hypothetical protein GPOALKHO_001366 [Sodalis sp.]
MTELEDPAPHTIKSNSSMHLVAANIHRHGRIGFSAKITRQVTPSVSLLGTVRNEETTTLAPAASELYRHAQGRSEIIEKMYQASEESLFQSKLWLTILDNDPGRVVAQYFQRRALASWKTRGHHRVHCADVPAFMAQKNDRAPKLSSTSSRLSRQRTAS